MNVLDEFKNYKRKFIQISHRTAILMHIFEKSDDDFAADQFFKQFEGHENLYFVECLRDKCNEMLKEHEDRVQKLKLNESNSN